MSGSNPVDIGALLADLAEPQHPDYFDDVLARAVRGPQRPAWTFPERWLPMSVIARRPIAFASVPWRSLGILAILALLVAAALLIAVGSPRPVPAPYGPAGNGLVAYAVDGDIYARDLATGEVEILIGAPEADLAPQFSRDGTFISFMRESAGPVPAQTLMVASADGTQVRAVLGPLPGFGWQLSPFGDTVAVLTDVRGVTTLSTVSLRDSARRDIELPFVPIGGGWRPPDGQELVMLGQANGRYAIHAFTTEGQAARPLTPEAGQNAYREPFSFSPDGTKLAYGNGQWPYSVHILDLDSGVDRRFGNALPPPAADPGEGDIHAGAAVFSPDGSQIVFGRYWDEHDGTINHQVWVASADGDGEDAVPVGPVHRSRSGYGPFSYAFSPDGKEILIQMNEVSETWLADPAGGAPERLDWGITTELFDWQRTLP